MSIRCVSDPNGNGGSIPEILFYGNTGYNKKMAISGFSFFKSPKAAPTKKEKISGFRPTVLVILDGFGVPQDRFAPYYAAKHPNFELLEKFFPFISLQASGIAAGLSWGQEGNSEVGHLTIGSGKILYHHLPRIVMAIQDGSFFQNPSFKRAAETVKKKSSQFHVMGLFSSGSVHAYPDHLLALLDFAKAEGLKNVFLHLFTDGRDSPIRESATFFQELEARISEHYPFARVASMIGRSYAMDRDQHWDKIEKAYRLLAEGAGRGYQRASEYAKSEHEAGRTDEFIEPGFLAGEAGKAVGRIRPGDAVVFFNFREDSTRELTRAFVDASFDGFGREKLSPLLFVTMTEYERGLPVEVAFPPLTVDWPIARVVAEAGLSQLHAAETEKYAHVTYFFNGGLEEPFPREERILIPSLPGANLADHPEMSTDKVTQAVVGNLAKHDFIMVNFANADMMGHTGDFEATRVAVEVIDSAVGKIMTAVLEAGGALVITADHGNAEEKRYLLTGEVRTKHTANPVPLYLAAHEYKLAAERSPDEIKNVYKTIGGVLSDVAPTVLELMGLSVPADMNGASLLEKLRAQTKKT